MLAEALLKHIQEKTLISSLRCWRGRQLHGHQYIAIYIFAISSGVLVGFGPIRRGSWVYTFVTQFQFVFVFYLVDSFNQSATRSS